MTMQRPLEIKVTFNKKDGKLGLLLKRNESSVVVSEIMDGTCREWNRKHRDRQVLVGDHLVEVNGHRNPVQLVRAVKAESRIDMVLYRFRRTSTLVPVAAVTKNPACPEPESEPNCVF